MKNKIIFIIQGEGRGHFTQAIAAYEMLTAAGYEVYTAVVGSSQRRNIPGFVKERIPVPFVSLPSPNFSTDAANKAIKLRKTFIQTMMHMPQYLKSMRHIRDIVAQHEPVLVMNFFEPLCALSKICYRWRTPLLSIAHQYLYLHPEYRFPAGAGWLKPFYLRMFTRLTAGGADALMALSFYPLSKPQYGRLVVSPPLLRQNIFSQPIYAGDHYLVYLVNAGYVQTVIDWHHAHPHVRLHCFTDSNLVKGTWQYSENLSFHSLDDVRFLRYMASARGLITTAGFETVAEAMYLGKPVLMIPVAGHFEQWCNARDGAKAGAGIYADRFALEMIGQLQPQPETFTVTFRLYAQEVQNLLLKTIQNITAHKHTTQHETLVARQTYANPTAASGL